MECESSFGSRQSWENKPRYNELKFLTRQLNKYGKLVKCNGWNWCLCQKSIKIIQSKCEEIEVNDDQSKTKRKMMKVSQNLPMMPNFGGECKTTGLEKIAAQLA